MYSNTIILCYTYLLPPQNLTYTSLYYQASKYIHNVLGWISKDTCNVPPDVRNYL